MIPRIKVDYTPKTADYEAFRKSFIGRAKKLTRIAIGEFVMASAKEIPVDTGMARASLKALGSQEAQGPDGRGISVPIGAKKREFVKGYYDISGDYHPDGLRNEARGTQLGKMAYDFGGNTMGGYINMRFRYSIKVWQWLLWEYSWLALATGREAFLSFFKDNRAFMVPELSEWIKEK